MGFDRKMRRQQKKQMAVDGLVKADALLGKLEVMQELANVLGPIGTDLKEARQALAMVIQDQGEADRRFERFRRAIILALRQDFNLTTIEESLDHYEKVLLRDEGTNAPEEVACPSG